MAPNIHHTLFWYSVLCLLVCTTKKLKVVYRCSTYQWLLYYQRYLFSGLEQYARYNQWVISPNKHHNLILIHFVCTYIHNSKNMSHVLNFYMLNDSSTIWHADFLVRATCEIWWVSHGSKHASRSFQQTFSILIHIN